MLPSVSCLNANTASLKRCELGSGRRVSDDSCRKCELASDAVLSKADAAVGTQTFFAEPSTARSAKEVVAKSMQKHEISGNLDEWLVSNFDAH